MDKELWQVVDKKTYSQIIARVVSTRQRLSDGRSFSYSEINFPWEGKIIKVMGRHFPIESVLANANKSCKDCTYGRGYRIAYLSKKKFPNPSQFLLDESELKEQNTPIQLASPHGNPVTDDPCWKTMSICHCAVKRTHLKNPRVLSNELHNIWMTLDYEIVDAPKEEVKS